MSEVGKTLTIQTVGPGCSRCDTAERHVFEACAELGLPADITHVRDWKEYAKMGIVFTPAVIINGKVVVSGRVPSVRELKELLRELATQPASFGE